MFGEPEGKAKLDLGESRPKAEHAVRRPSA